MALFAFSRFLHFWVNVDNNSLITLTPGPDLGFWLFTFPAPRFPSSQTSRLVQLWHHPEDWLAETLTGFHQYSTCIQDELGHHLHC